MKCLTVKKLASRMNIKLISFGLFTNDYPREFKNGNAVGEKRHRMIDGHNIILCVLHYTVITSAEAEDLAAVIH